MRLVDKVAVVTGGSRGIGRAISVGLAAEGAAVAIVYAENRDAAEDTLKQIAITGSPGIAIGADISSVAGVRRVVDMTLDSYGRIDVLVNVAGRIHFSSFFDITEAEWDEQVDVNAKALLFLSQAVASTMKDGGGGRIVNVTSISGERADPDLVAYSASKAAANMLTKAMAVALGPHNITVNAVLPGTTVTDMNRARLEDVDFRRHLEDLTPLGRLGRPDDIVGAVAYLASDAAAWTSGAMIRIDGGFMS